MEFLCRRISLQLIWMGLMALATPGAVFAQTIKPAELTVPTVCPNGFTYGAAKVCEADPKVLAAFDVNQCVGQGLKWEEAKPTGEQCTADKSKAPKPQCDSRVPDLVLKDGECVIDKKTPVSMPGDYEGDCLRVSATPTTDVLAFVPSRYLKVQSQEVRNGEKVLRVVAADENRLFGCSPRNDVYREVPVRALEAAGVQRSGWSYGVLTLPFKYHKRDKGFSSSASLGPFLGWRLDYPGSARTIAASATIGTVKGEVKDAQGNITGTPELVSFAIAAGMMFDIAKAPVAKPFKAGIFFGKDFVGADKAATYKYDRKTWIAFQLGFDFTDN